MNIKSAKQGQAEVRKLPEPPLAGGGVPVFGHAGKLIRDPLALLTTMRDYGDVIRLRLGPKIVYAVTAPDLTGTLVTRPEFQLGGPLWDTMEMLLGKGVANSNGPWHRRQRQTIQPSFRPNVILEYQNVMAEEAQALSDRLRSGHTVDVTQEAYRTAVRITTRCFLQVENSDDLAERLSDALGTVFAGLYRRMILSFGPFHRLPTPANRAFDRALAELHRLADAVIADRLASGQRPDDLLTALLDAKDENGDPVSHQEVHDQVIAILTPGSETIGSQLLLLLQLMTDHPDQADRLSAEVRSVVGDRQVTIADLKNMPHTNNVITEALRIRPAVWILTRRAVTDTELGGYHIPAGADIVYSPLAIQRDARSFERHLEFDPDRWLPERSKDVPKFAMVPFSAGNRKCPGDHFSVAEMGMLLATVVPQWRFEHVPEADLSVRFGMTLRPKRLILRTRSR